MQPFFPKTQGFACKSGVILEFWLHAVKLSLAWREDAYSFKQALKRFLKLNQRSINALFKQSLIPYIDLSWACDPSLRAFDML
ncbi:hypothetical protein BTM491_11010 [Helicobacter pylori]